MKTGKEAADEPYRRQRRKAHPESESSGELHVAGSHDSECIEKKQKAEADACAEQGASPVLLDGSHSRCKRRKSQEGTRKHKPIGNAALPEVIDGNE